MIVCFDIGGSAIKGAIVHSRERIFPLPRRTTPLTNFRQFVQVLESVLDEAGGHPDCVAISITGVIDPETRRIKCANIPCIDGRELVAELEAALHLPVRIANDADCFALAEAGAGAGRGHRIVFGAILGTGVGGGLVIDGRLINADGGFAGEWGHGPAIAAEAGNPPIAIPAYECGCGQRRCVDTVGGARGLERLHQTAHGKTLSSHEIIEAWQAGNTEAKRTVELLVDLVSSPLALVINISGATIVPVGGGLSNSEELLAEIDRAVRSRILRQFDRPLVVRGECRVEPGLIGAALLGLGEERV
ncbi:MULTISPECIES: ROK family protein [unclassified Ensifer]|uniref:ROK family protein n=1 Tax=unclassified Ensifer TaxID=2633371 RepID=UPI0008130BE0|nr:MULTISPECIES: ROK family protein [unclassified Ensifer]OCO98739.1 N-acetylglucosamine kinase [Ensifer sp. LC14]OCP13218.1 N-acetylglucosamine kinase [Ensifer sp. LC13]OCP13821.1 N-acetylglucosamine kinase [Ensifer sp. LC11]OCP28199.1 N-acetylglucosamine kinase [Ensifer sp. LC499]